MKWKAWNILWLPALCVLWIVWTGASPHPEGKSRERLQRDTTELLYKQVDLDSLMMWGEDYSRAMSRDSAWRLVAIAREYIGCPYVWATHGPRTFDCSGFTGFVYSFLNLNISYSSEYQGTVGRQVVPGLENLQTGDIVLFGSRKNPAKLGHVGMVIESFPDLGYFTFIHAASNGVEEQRSDGDYYRIRYLGARRILQDFVGYETGISQ